MIKSVEVSKKFVNLKIFCDLQKLVRCPCYAMESQKTRWDIVYLNYSKLPALLKNYKKCTETLIR